MKTNHIVIAGTGGIGRAAGLILAELASFPVFLHMGDRTREIAEDALDWIREGSTRQVAATAFAITESEPAGAFLDALKQGDILLDCTPGHLAPRMARLASEFGMHYANLTEYVQETNEVTAIADGGKTGFILQTGLAPGYINVLACYLHEQFTQLYEPTRINKIKMRVGALTRHAEAPHFYGFTWSPVGVATEYLKDAIVIRNGAKTSIPALSGYETILIDGLPLEEDLTSGGAADLPDYFNGKVNELDYKTLRYQGHYAWVKEQLVGIDNGKNRIEQLQTIMEQNIPNVEDDLVVVYASVSGNDKNGVYRAIQKSLLIRPVVVGKHTLRAIQATTAAPLVECAAMLLRGGYKGPIFQSQIHPEEFLRGYFVQFVYGDPTA